MFLQRLIYNILSVVNLFQPFQPFNNAPVFKGFKDSTITKSLCTNNTYNHSHNGLTIQRRNICSFHRFFIPLDIGFFQYCFITC